MKPPSTFSIAFNCQILYLERFETTVQHFTYIATLNTNLWNIWNHNTTSWFNCNSLIQHFDRFETTLQYFDYTEAFKTNTLKDLKQLYIPHIANTATLKPTILKDLKPLYNIMIKLKLSKQIVWKFWNNCTSFCLKFNSQTQHFKRFETTVHHFV